MPVIENRPVQSGRAPRIPWRLDRRAGFVGVSYAFVATMLGTTLPTPLYSHYQQRFGFSELTITVIFATYAAGVIAALLLLGRLSDEAGRRPVLLAGLGFSALSAVVFLLAGGLAPLLVGRLLSGFSAGIFTGTATATLVDLAPPGGQGQATLVAAMANMGGLGCGPLLAGILVQIAPQPIRLSFWVDLGLLIPAVIAILLMPEPVSRHGRVRWRPQSLAVPAQVRAIFIRAALAAFAGFAVLGLSTAVSPAFLGKVLSINNDAVVGVVVFGVFLASTVGQLLLEVVPDRVALSAGCLGLIGGMAVFAGGLAASSLALLVLGAVLAGVGQGLSFRSGLAGVTSASPPAQRAEVASSFFVVAYVAISIPVIGEGVLADVSSLRTAGLIFAGLVAALAALVVVLLGRRARGAR